MPSNSPRVRWQFRLITLLTAVTLIAMPLAIYANHLQRVRRQEAAFQFLVARGATIFSSRNEGTHVNFMIRSENDVAGASCSNEVVLCPDYGVPPNFADADIGALEDIMMLRSVNFWGTKISDHAVNDFHQTHPSCSVSHACLIYDPKRPG